MSRYLMVPVQLDALYVAGEELSVAKLAPDFMAQPYTAPELQQQINGDTPNLSEALVNPPFQTKTIRLSHGVHLHWAMPDALTRGDGGLNFPNVPDRWLVTRKRRELNSKQWRHDKQWVVESNYLFPPNINKQGLSIGMPHSSADWLLDKQSGVYHYSPGKYHYLKAQIPAAILSNSDVMETMFSAQDGDTLLLILDAESLQNKIRTLGETDEIGRTDIVALLNVLQQPLGRSLQPFRYMGRKLPASAYRAQVDGAEYYQNLSAVGYGDPGFAAYYPNCFSVFGCHDQNPGDDLSLVRYEVTGWYANASDDVLASFIATLDNNESESINAAIEQKFNWKVSSDTAPQKLLCYGNVGFDSFNSSYQSDVDDDISVTVANAPTEALSACLADKLVKDQPGLTIKQQQKYLLSLEDQFEAMQMAYRLDSKKLDVLSRFKELRHENGFTPVNSGHLWTIRKHFENANHVKQNDDRSTLPELPDAIAAQLDQLNLRQQAYDKACREVSSLRRQLFADWYKYMICVYPPDLTMSDYPSVDLLKYFLEAKGLLPLEEQIASTGELGDVKTDNTGHIVGINVTPESQPDSIAVLLRQKLDDLLHQLDLVNKNIPPSTDGSYCVEQIPASRFWQANNPVILLEGDAVKATQRHGADGLLLCPIYDKGNDGSFDSITDFAHLSEHIATVISEQVNVKTQQPWNPYLLQWQTQLFNTQTKSNVHSNQGYYSESFITQNYQATVREPDLVLKPHKGGIVQSGDSYSGESILTSQANRLLKTAIEKQLIDRLSIFGNVEDISIANYPGKQEYNNPIFSMICAYEKLKSTHTLAQSLNGFNQGLLMRKQTLELQVDDPLGFDVYRQFSNDRVAHVMADDIKEAPSPLSAFNPIRTGCIKFIKLRLIDTFGQVKNISVDKIDTSYKLTSPSSQYLVKMPPRLAQPARLSFRWLDAAGIESETNSHPNTSPICGWLLNNKLDHSVMIYSRQGKALGYFKAGRWYQAIDSDSAIAIEQIDNPHLKRVVQYIDSSIQEDSGFIEHFIGTTEDALANIQTENNTDANGTASLIGRPMAVVRATLSLQLGALPAVNQGWNVLRGDIGKNSRTTDSYTRVKFPVRLGEYGQLNDGLVGYWLEKKADDGSILFASERLDEFGKETISDKSLFYSPQSQYIDSQSIESRFDHLENAPINFYQSLEDPAQTLTMLMDVQGSVHATVGILPNREIKIPTDHYTQALQNIEVSFLHAPILTPSGQTRLPLRPIKGYEWTWVEREKSLDGQLQWQEKFVDKRIAKEQFITQFQQQSALFGQQGDPESLWRYLLQNDVAWLAHIDDDEDGNIDVGQAKLVSADGRKVAADSGFAAPFGGLETTVEQVFKRAAIGLDPTFVDADFVTQQRIREGWLKLRHRRDN